MGLSLLAGPVLVLRGERCDYLYDAEGRQAWQGTELFAVEQWKTLEPAYYFAVKQSIYRFRDGVISCSGRDWKVKVKDCLLPIPSVAVSIEGMVSGNCIYLPVRAGFLVLDTRSQSQDILTHQWQPSQIPGGALKLSIPQFSGAKEQLWSLESGHLRHLVNGNWKEVVMVPEKDLIEAHLLAGDRFVNLLLFKVTQGDLGSFRTRLLSFSADDGHQLMDREFGGVLKNPAVDSRGRVIFEYVKASIFSAFLGRNKVRWRVIDPGKNKVKDDSVSVGDKRRHLFYVENKQGNLLLVVQCKNGDVFVIDPFNGDSRKLKVGKFGYDYTLIRGVGNGVFYNEKTGNRVAVSFDAGSGGS